MITLKKISGDDILSNYGEIFCSSLYFSDEYLSFYITFFPSGAAQDNMYFELSIHTFLPPVDIDKMIDLDHPRHGMEFFTPTEIINISTPIGFSGKNLALCVIDTNKSFSFMAGNINYTIELFNDKFIRFSW